MPGVDLGIWEPLSLPLDPNNIAILCGGGAALKKFE